MATLGFKSVEFGIHDGDTEIVKKIYKLDANEGGTIEAKLSGLGAQINALYASNVPFFVDASGTGTPQLEFTAADLSEEIAASISGAVYENGILKLGKDAKAPYVSVLLEADGIKNDSIYIALLKGKFGHPDGVDLKTGDDKGKEADTTDSALTGQFVNRKLDGFTYFKTRSSNTDFDLQTFRSLVFNGYNENTQTATQQTAG
ncbi:MULTISPECIES: major tail protein [Heyndrickxia]|jgi:phi13 family phage major tail protein|uniref:Phage tail protein n=2 Tax=Heyndrickxia TaxID=2837504 RepID=A0A150KGX5_HEYCO|nr:major tail protein [Heyndrickxia coagulans]AVD56211.1 phage tail protein [Heyndrickxia coagulans]KYC71636.1 hypothetical protein B4099_3177 [Heyndrickxia coagulans]